MVILMCRINHVELHMEFKKKPQGLLTNRCTFVVTRFDDTGRLVTKPYEQTFLDNLGVRGQFQHSRPTAEYVIIIYLYVMVAL